MNVNQLKNSAVVPKSATDQAAQSALTIASVKAAASVTIVASVMIVVLETLAMCVMTLSVA